MGFIALENKGIIFSVRRRRAKIDRIKQFGGLKDEDDFHAVELSKSEERGERDFV